jgi:thiol-disulfide isomerase/thioredoxin
MSGRLAVVAGVIAGLATVAIVIGALVAATPVPTAPPAATIAAPSRSAAAPAASASASASAQPSPPSASPGALFHVGEPAPTLVVPEVGGGTIDLARLRGKPVWVNFWGTYCPPCEAEFPLMNGYAARYEPQGLVILAIDVREDEETAAGFASRLGVVFPIGLDPQGTNATAWDALVLPTHFWIDVEGIIRSGAAGGIGPDQMDVGLATILPSSGGSSTSSSPSRSP